ncbi:hypothetical protein HY374_03670 [Candidatus Berkelbacteria bacterium]|nr:hypothetical protein [Candidatus Berkelbacteria bacterium]
MQEAEQYLAKHAGLLLSRPKSPEVWLDRMRALCAELGNPQETYTTIHVAGTSGKGSTTTLIATILTAHGFRTGHTVSPYVISIRERIQLDGRPVTTDVFLAALSTVALAANRVAATKLGHPSSFELLCAASFLIFAEAHVDYAVTETGMGGRYDATNVVQRRDKLSVITRIGIDHQEYLGKTLRLIAAQKAAIIQPKTVAIVLAQPTQPVFTEQARRVSAVCHIITPQQAQRTASVTAAGTTFAYAVGDHDRVWTMALIGRHQVENAILALEAVQYLSERDSWHLRVLALQQALRQTALPARFTILKKSGKTVVIDGAHNAQKLTAFLATLKECFPHESPTFVVAFRHGKPVRLMLQALARYLPRRQAAGGEVIFTEFELTNDLIIRSESAQHLKQLWGRRAATAPARAIADPKEALTSALARPGRLVVVTGSLYLAGSILPTLDGVRD